MKTRKHRQSAECPNGAFVRNPSVELFDMTEEELIREILFGSKRLYEFFGFVMTDVHGLRSEDGWDYLFFGNIPRTDLGLPRLGKPGDIDVMIIPYRKGLLHIDKTAAIEIKRLSLRGPRWDKTSDSFGITQAGGLLEAGFPYVGLLHLIVHACGPPTNHRTTLTAQVLDSHGRISFTGDRVTDMTGSITADRQLGRLLARQPHPAIGLNCVSFSDIDFAGERCVMIGIPTGRTALRKPYASSERMAAVSSFIKGVGKRLLVSRRG